MVPSEATAGCWSPTSIPTTDYGASLGDVWTVEGDCHVPMGSYVLNCVACDFALEARKLSELDVVNVGQPDAVAFDTAGIVSKLEGDSLGSFVLLRVLCFASYEVLEGGTEIAQ